MQKQKWIFIYTTHPKQQYATLFEASDREIAEWHVDIFFRMMMGIHWDPKVLRTAWLPDEKFGVNAKVFVGSIKEEGENRGIFSGVLYNVAEIKREYESQPDTELLEKLKKHTDVPPI